MGWLSRKLEEKRLRLLVAARRGAFESYMRHGRVPEAYARIAAVASEAKALNTDVSLDALGPGRLPAGRPTTHYVWRSAGDSRVRGSHAARNGQIFAWSNPPEHGHPGQEPNCRCWPEPYYGNPAVPDRTLALRYSKPGRAVGAFWDGVERVSRPDGSLVASLVVGDDGTRIRSTFVGSTVEHVITLPEGHSVRVERRGETQRVFIVGNPEPLVETALTGGPRVRALRLGVPPLTGPAPPLPLPWPPAPAGDERPTTSAPSEQPREILLPVLLPATILRRALVGLFNAIAEQLPSFGAGSNDVPVVVYKVWAGGDGTPVAVAVNTLAAEQVSQWCPAYNEVLSLGNQAALDLAATGRTMTPTQWGTAFHKALHDSIQWLKRHFPSAYQNLDSELSIAPDGRISTDEGGPYYSQAGTIRADVYEQVNPEVTCVYDAKTGKAELTAARVAQFAQAVWRRSPGSLFYIVRITFPGPTP